MQRAAAAGYTEDSSESSASEFVPPRGLGGPGAAGVLLVIGSGQLLCLLVVSVFMVS